MRFLLLCLLIVSNGGFGAVISNFELVKDETVLQNVTDPSKLTASVGETLFLTIDDGRRFAARLDSVRVSALGNRLLSGQTPSETDFVLVIGADGRVMGAAIRIVAS